MNPFFFGPSERPLFGLFTQSRVRGVAPGAVLLCYPVAGEYLRAHRAFRQMNNLLNRAGLSALRFDYSSTGDSWGDAEDARLANWLDDVDWAIDELMDNAGVESVSIVGLRFGATIATLAAAERPADVDRLVLWDPIVSGRDYLDHTLGSDRPTATVGVEGYPVTPTLQREIDAVDLMKLDTLDVESVSILGAEDDAAYHRLAGHLEALGVSTDLEIVPSSGNWAEADPFGAALIPDRIIQAAVSRLERAGASS